MTEAMFSSDARLLQNKGLSYAGPLACGYLLQVNTVLLHDWRFVEITKETCI